MGRHSAKAGLSPALRGLLGGALLLLGLAGAWLGQRLVSTLALTAQARDWVAVPAQLQGWQVARASGSIRPLPGALPVQALQARYRYVLADQPYLGDQVATAALRDNFSDRHRDRIAALLREADANAGRLTVWVDPAQPGRALIDRRLPVASCTFLALGLLFPCGLASLVVLSQGLAWGRRAAGRDLRPLALPMWALLHALPALPIVLLATPGDIGLGNAVALGLLGVLGLLGLLGLLRAGGRLAVAPGG